MMAAPDRPASPQSPERRSDPTYGRIDPDIQQAVDDMEPKSLGQRVAMENTLQARRDGRPTQRRHRLVCSLGQFKWRPTLRHPFRMKWVYAGPCKCGLGEAVPRGRE